MKKLQKKDAAAKYILPTGHVSDTPYFFLYQLRSPTKWPQAQQRLSDYFVKNPTPTRAPPPRGALANESSSKYNDSKGESSNHQHPALPAVSKQDSRLPPPPQFWQQFLHQIVVESRADKAKEEEAKLSTIMLSLFLAGGSVDWEEGKITSVRVPTPTQEYKNILAQKSSVRPTQAANILFTVFTTTPNRFTSVSLLCLASFPWNFSPRIWWPLGSTQIFRRQTLTPSTLKPMPSWCSVS